MDTRLTTPEDINSVNSSLIIPLFFTEVNVSGWSSPNGDFMFQLRPNQARSEQPLKSMYSDGLFPMTPSVLFSSFGHDKYKIIPIP